ncbi:MAG: EpsG family protein [Prevotella sp.]|nr:EpsG family protein [Prevotella sp.]
MIYAIPYVLLVCFFGIAAWRFHYADDSDIRNRITLLCIFVFVFFFGFRGFCFYDWYAYYPIFLQIDLHTLDVSMPYEPGFSLLMAICKSLFNNYHFFILVCCLINTVLLLRFFQQRINNIPLGLMIYICMGGLGLSTDLIRNSISILLFINSLQYIEERKPIPFFLINAVGMTFHLSAFFYFPLYFFLHRRYSKWIYLAIFAIGNLIYIFHIPVFLTLVSFIAGIISPQLNYKIMAYTELMPSDGFRLSIGYLERLLTGILIFLYIGKLRDIRKDNDIFINSILLYFAMFFFFSEFKTVGLRFSNLFCYAYWILWIDLIKCFAIENNRKLFIFFLSIYCVLKIYGSTNNIIARYDNVLINAQPFHIREQIFNKNFNDI